MNAKEKTSLFDFKNMRIQERLKKSYNMVHAIATVAAILGIIAIFVISANYKNAMDNYALPQGEIGQLMEAFLIILEINALGDRFKNFAGGDISSEFPTVDTKDEISDMLEEATDMAGKLQLIVSVFEILQNNLNY